jgi:Domain of unknown function (DUF4214)/Putative binding domain, N-terminal
MKKNFSLFILLCTILFIPCLCQAVGEIPDTDNSEDAMVMQTASSGDLVRDFANRFYEVVLNRPAETVGLDYWTNSLKNGTKAGADVAWGFIFSQEFMNQQLDNASFLNVLYSAFFNRQADSGGHSYWLAKLNTGETKQNVVNGFIYSQEFYNLCLLYNITPTPCNYNISSSSGSFTSSGGTSSISVTATTSICAWTASESLSWVTLSSTGGTGSGTVTITENANTGAARTGSVTIAGKTYTISQAAFSADLVRDFVSRFYEVVLGRTAETAGLDYWTSSLIDGTRAGADVAWGFVFSQEFMNQQLDNTSYLNVLYSAFFNRQPDSGGHSYWLGKLNTGETRQNVLNGFIYSQEFSNLCQAYSIMAVK